MTGTVSSTTSLPTTYGRKHSQSPQAGQSRYPIVAHTFETDADDIFLFKNRYSALIQGSSDLQKVLNDRGIRNLLVTGTKTNVCCEATARDAMMLDYNTVMISDATAGSRTTNTARPSRPLFSNSGT